jgi:hypothetical protein
MIFRRSEKSEDIIKRKSYYGFAKYYPGKMGTKKYVIGESKVAEKKEKIRNILAISGYIILFILAFFITSVCIEISESPIV